MVKRNCKSYAGKIIAHRRTVVNKNVVLGHNVNFNGMIITPGGNVVIGNNFHSGCECMIITAYHNYDAGDAIPYDDSIVCRDVTIEDNVWLGNRVIILAGITIGEGAVIQAGSVVTNDIPALAVAGGHPARVFKYRNREHYYRLKELKKFN